MNALASAVEIAAALGLSEARASQLVWLARCREKRLPAEMLMPSGAVRTHPP
jgi:hypothetical protein